MELNDTELPESSDDGLYEDIAKKKSKSLKKSEGTALRCFNKFLEELNNSKPIRFPHKSLATFSTAELNHISNIFGMFPSYLLITRKLKQATAMSYLSQIHKLIAERCPTTDIMLGRYYKNLRHNTSTTYTKHHQSINTKKSNPATPMSSEDLSELCNLLFVRNTTKCIQERALLVLQWQALGRVSETTALTYESIGWHAHYACMTVEMNRQKVDLQHTIHCFLHSNNWLICPLHALGKHTYNNNTEFIYTNTIFMCIYSVFMRASRSKY